MLMAIPPCYHPPHCVAMEHCSGGACWPCCYPSSATWRASLDESTTASDAQTEKATTSRRISRNLPLSSTNGWLELEESFHVLQPQNPSPNARRLGLTILSQYQSHASKFCGSIPRDDPSCVRPSSVEDDAQATAP